MNRGCKPRPQGGIKDTTRFVAGRFITIVSWIGTYNLYVHAGLFILGDAFNKATLPGGVNNNQHSLVGV